MGLQSPDHRFESGRRLQTRLPSAVRANRLRWMRMRPDLARGPLCCVAAWPGRVLRFEREAGDRSAPDPPQDADRERDSAFCRRVGVAPGREYLLQTILIFNSDHSYCRSIHRAWRAPEHRRVRERTMLICHCNGISDRKIRVAIRNGARTPADVGRACGAGSGCGGCLDAVRELIHTEATHRVEANETPPRQPLTHV